MHWFWLALGGMSRRDRRRAGLEDACAHSATFALYLREVIEIHTTYMGDALGSVVQAATDLRLRRRSLASAAQGVAP